MSITSGFFDSLNGDRKYNALQLSSIFDGIIADGVYATYGEHFLVEPVSGMSVKVGSGRAWLDHTWTLNDAAYPITVAAAEVVLKRIDTVIIEVDRSNSGRNNTIKIVKGTPGSEPIAPVLTSSGDIKQYPLADILVKPNVTEITVNDITNRIGTAALPWVTGVINHVTADDLISQWESEFNILFAELKAQISQATSQTLIDGSVTGQKIANKTITAGNIADGTISLDKMANDARFPQVMLIETSGVVVLNETWGGKNVVCTNGNNIQFNTTIMQSLPDGWRCRIYALFTQSIVTWAATQDAAGIYNIAEGLAYGVVDGGVAVPLNRYIDIEKISWNIIALSGNFADRNIRSGTAEPTAGLGVDGDIYIQYTT